MGNLEDRVHRALQDPVQIEPYNPEWPALFRREERHLRECLPKEMVGRIEHFGSTAVPGLAAKPVIDMLIEVRDLAETRRRIVPILEGQGYEYFWRPTFGDDEPPFYAWFIRRDQAGQRTHHLHMVEPDFPHWDRLLFRDMLRARPKLAREYQVLKQRLAEAHPHDRIAYTEGKTDFILRATEETAT
jgi:GrpB-like predicted nucleotidyltransferase (UPF0157 family)